MSNYDAEIIEKKYRYRRLLLRGKLKLPHDAAKKLIGVDTAYHLYSLDKKEKKDDDEPKNDV